MNKVAKYETSLANNKLLDLTQLLDISYIFTGRDGKICQHSSDYLIRPTPTQESIW